MTITFNTAFDWQFDSRLTNVQKLRVLDVLEVFAAQPLHKDLRNHELRGVWLGFRSISVDGDLRLHYQLVGSNTAMFVAVGTHKQLYK